MIFHTLKKRFITAIGAGAVLLGMTAFWAATGANGTMVQAQVPPVAVVPLAPVAVFGEINFIRVRKQTDTDPFWMSRIKTEGQSDLHVVQVTIQPGASLPWHTHIGPSFVIVKSGTATFYHGNDPTCTAESVPAGTSLFEPGDDLHIVRNEGTEPLVNIVVQLIPHGAQRLIPQPNPGNCPF